MCGIVGYVGGRPCRQLLVAGLEKLEYRGYDSAGISVLADGRISSVRAVGNLAHLRAAVDPVERESEEVTWDEEAAEKGGYSTFMMKEIHEQPEAVAESIADRLSGD